MSKITDKLIFDFIKFHYRPYDTHEEFGRGFSAYQAGNFRNPHEADSVSAQAWDRGVEAVSRSRQFDGCEIEIIDGLPDWSSRTSVETAGTGTGNPRRSPW